MTTGMSSPPFRCVLRLPMGGCDAPDDELPGVVPVAGGLSSCGGDGDEDGDADSDADGEAHSDTEGDGDSDGEADVDGVGDADSDGDADGDADGNCSPGCEDGWRAPGDWATICSGTFTMGSPSGELGREDDETQHEVTLTGDFVILSTEVTQGAFEALMGYDPSSFSGCADCPVEGTRRRPTATRCRTPQPYSVATRARGAALR